ncbi:MAG: AlkA N-terminal domain-containing protein [Planctomycetota bacterium]
MNSTRLPLDRSFWESVRRSRDARFDGLVYIAVTSTRIFCRPICPARTPREDHVRYFATRAEAVANGFRPCLRCRPEAAPGSPAWDPSGDLIARALCRIEDGFLEHAKLVALARALAIGERQLRRLFVARLGASPLKVDSTRRVLFAKKLLTETTLPITQVALASGFRSLRRFNAAFRQAFERAPRELRRRVASAPSGELVLSLPYREPFDFAALLEFHARRALPGLERVDGLSYEREFVLPEGPGWLRVERAAAPNLLTVRLRTPVPTVLPDLVARVRRLFDLDADPAAINAVLSRDALLGPVVRRHPGQRVPGAWDGFELAVRAVLGQQVSVAAARTFAMRLVAAGGSEHAFPTPKAIIEMDLSRIGLTRRRCETLAALARAVHDGEIEFHAGQDLATFVAALCQVEGIGAWTAHYVALRALRHPDAFPAADLVLRQVAGSKNEPLKTRALEQLSQPWRPWRSYAVLHLWRLAN